MIRLAEWRRYGGELFSAVNSLCAGGFRAIGGKAEASLGLGYPYIIKYKPIYKLRLSAKGREACCCLAVYGGDCISACSPLIRLLSACCFSVTTSVFIACLPALGHNGASILGREVAYGR